MHVCEHETVLKIVCGDSVQHVSDLYCMSLKEMINTQRLYFSSFLFFLVFFNTLSHLKQVTMMYHCASILNS